MNSARLHPVASMRATASPRRAGIVILALGGLLGLFFAMTVGCTVRAVPARFLDRLEEIPLRDPSEIAWPARHTEPLVWIAQRQRAQTRADGTNRYWRSLERVVGREGTTFHGVFGQGIIAQSTVALAMDEPQRFNVITTPFTLLDIQERLRLRAEFEARQPPTEPEAFESWVMRMTGIAVMSQTSVINSLTCTLREPEHGPARGLVVHLTSLVRDSPYETAVIQRLRAEGWAVLEIGHPTRMFDPNLYIITATSDPAKHGPIIAEWIDERLAEWAYGVETALLYLNTARPELAQTPLVLAGFSLGALVLPAVAARLGEDVDAAILIAGGANLAEILSNIVLTNGTQIAGFSLVYMPDVPRAQREAVVSAYLEASQLDPHHTAAALHGKPVLMLHALFDAIVPADTGTLLYNRLGRPERWRYAFGHFGLFWWLPNEAGAIASWLDQRFHAPRE